MATASATPTIFEDRSETGSVNEQFQHQFFPGLEERKKDPYLVEFDPDDPLNPHNWSRVYRWYLTGLGGILVLNATFASSAPSGIARQLMQQFGFSMEVAVLTIALFVGGYCVGPLLWGPLSEQYGRRPVFIITFFVYTCFQIGCALSQNTASIIIFRLLGGTFAAAPLTNSGALISDMWDAGTRGKALALFTLAPFAGPSLGPVVSGYLTTAGVSWRWLFWILTMFAGVCFILIAFTLPETYAPVIMASKAKAMRLRTGDDNYYAPIEKEEKEHWLKRIEHTVARPFKILFQEPMLIAITVYMSFVYGCIYLLFEAYPIVFEEGHGFSPGATGLTFIPVFLGGVTGVIVYLLIFNPQYERLIEEYKPNMVPPEKRMNIAVIAAPIFAVSFFWFGWTSYPSISFWAPMLAGLAMGFSVVFIFLALFNYMIDAYLFVAASALAANTVVRSSFGAAFPLFATQMYNALNPRWASTLVGLVAVVMIPIPVILRRYGAKLRKHSKHAPKVATTKPKIEEPEV
ncbi:MFS general substrate transporter [Fomitiporia mediterranea MF3/22]|uniref:MFS general substrate transporter n=1 Tax=Fomitiporia mediterranea (strain MF3/22) TaxID=694068 RepID=UPI0004408165|nr:MFS general substrate transporter [Fomitiporia mediterranea MF3/22]EJD04165.1 MFS general substrate transporter [Fomitiporia mediterranea MF3/22]